MTRRSPDGVSQPALLYIAVVIYFTNTHPLPSLSSFTLQDDADAGLKRTQTSQTVTLFQLKNRTFQVHILKSCFLKYLRTSSSKEDLSSEA